MSLISFPAKGRDNSRLLDGYLRRIANHDADGLSLLYDETHTDLYAYALSILRNPQDAEDVLHDAYIKVYTSASGYTSWGKPMAWLVTITKSLCLMKLRAQSRQADVTDEELERTLSQQAGISHEDRLVLGQYLGLLAEDERQIVSLHAVSGLKHREISQMLDMPAATVRSKYNRAIKKLKDTFEKEGF